VPDLHFSDAESRYWQEALFLLNQLHSIKIIAAGQPVGFPMKLTHYVSIIFRRALMIFVIAVLNQG